MHIDRNSVLLKIMNGFDGIEEAKKDAAVAFYVRDPDQSDRFSESSVSHLYSLRAELETVLTAYEQSARKGEAA